MKYTSRQILDMAQSLGVNMENITLKTLRQGVKVELEHGSKLPWTNITNDDLELTMKIVLAHLCEFPDYYEALEQMENRLKKKWKGKRKLRIRS